MSEVNQSLDSEVTLFLLATGFVAAIGFILWVLAVQGVYV